MTSGEAIAGFFGLEDVDLFAGIDDQRVVARLKECLAAGTVSRDTLVQAARLRSAAAARPARRAPSRVYFIQASITGLIKIGVAVDPSDRLRTLQTGSPDTLSLIKTIDGDQKLEQELHRRFADDRLHGEWFHPSADLLAYITEATS